MNRTSSFIAIVFALSFGISSSAFGQWIQTTGPLPCHFAISGSNLFSADDYQGVFLSSDNGMSWKLIRSVGRNTSISSLAVLGTQLYVGVLDSGLYRSADTGKSWKLITMRSISDYRLWGSGTTLFAVFDSGFYRSLDSGTSWTAMKGGFKQPLFVRELAASGKTIFINADTSLYLSTDDGQNWKALSTAFGVRHVAVSHGNCYAVISPTYDKFGVMFSRDLGTTWILGDTTAYQIFNFFITNGPTLFGGYNDAVGRLWCSTNNGASWKDVTDTNRPTTIYTFHRACAVIVSGPNVVVGSYNTGVWYCPLATVLKTVEGVEENKIALATINLSPNPTNGIVTVHGAPANVQHVVVTNLLGQTLIDLRDPHSSSFTLDFSKFVSGTYFVRIATTGGVVMKKVVRE